VVYLGARSNVLKSKIKIYKNKNNGNMFNVKNVYKKWLNTSLEKSLKKLDLK